MRIEWLPVHEGEWKSIITRDNNDARECDGGWNLINAVRKDLDEELVSEDGVIQRRRKVNSLGSFVLQLSRQSS